MSDIINDKSRELLSDVIPSDYESDCCGALVYAPTDDWAICMDCKEHCDAIKVENLFIKEQSIQRWDLSNTPAGYKE